MAEAITIPAGMKPWSGGDSAPEDWGGGPVLLANDTVLHSEETDGDLWWGHEIGEGLLGLEPGCVIAYTPKATDHIANAGNMILTCTCGAQNPRDLPYDMTKADACSTCGRAFGRPCVDPRQGVEVLPHLLEERRAWLPIAEAPYNEPVIVQIGSMTFAAILRPDASMSTDEALCDQWQAVNEGEHPPCWSDGACWSTNEYEVSSLQPERWRRAALANRPSDAVAGEG